MRLVLNGSSSSVVIVIMQWISRMPQVDVSFGLVQVTTWSWYSPLKKANRCRLYTVIHNISSRYTPYNIISIIHVYLCYRKIEQIEQSNEVDIHHYMAGVAHNSPVRSRSSRLIRNHSSSATVKVIVPLQRLLQLPPSSSPLDLFCYVGSS